MIWVLVVILIIGFFVWRMINNTKKQLSERIKQDIRANWRNINGLLNDSKESSWIRSVMEADKLLNYALEQFKVPGQSIGERLKNARPLFRNVDVAWRAHKVRNELAHDMDRRFNQTEARQVIGWFENALRQLDVL